MKKTLPFLIALIVPDLALAQKLKDPIIIPINVFPSSIPLLQQAVMDMGATIDHVSYHVKCDLETTKDHDYLYFIPPDGVTINNLKLDGQSPAAKNGDAWSIYTQGAGQYTFEFDYSAYPSDNKNLTLDNESNDTLAVTTCSGKTQ